MKTILAVGELGTFTNVYKASLVSMMAGEDVKHRNQMCNVLLNGFMYETACSCAVLNLEIIKSL